MTYIVSFLSWTRIPLIGHKQDHTIQPYPLPIFHRSPRPGPRRANCLSCQPLNLCAKCSSVVPSFFFPCGFHLKACLVTLASYLKVKVCPIHFQRLFFISNPIRDEPTTSCHRSFLMVLGHWMHNILLRREGLYSLCCCACCSPYYFCIQHWLDIALKNLVFALSLRYLNSNRVWLIVLNLFSLDWIIQRKVWISRFSSL